MIFREKIALDWSAIKNREPRDMPSGFTPDELWIEDDILHATVRARDGHPSITIGYSWSIDRENNAKEMMRLFRILWLELELARLGMTDESPRRRIAI